MVHRVRSTVRRLAAYWHILTRRDRVTSDMDEEMRFHVEMQTERLMKEQGLPAEEARRRALVSFGGLEKYKEAGHDVYGLRWLDALLLDSRFSLRMLLKHRGLTLAGTFAMAVAIAVGATAFEVVDDILDSPLPIPGGDRIVSLEFIGDDAGNSENQVIHEFAALHASMTTVEHFGGFHNAKHNLVDAETAPEPVQVAEITSSAFAITNTPALMGRYLLPSDESDAATPVLVIGHDAWRKNFASDPDVVGRTVQLGGLPRTIVGVMPEGYKFPTGHQFWVPFREDPLAHKRGEGPEIVMFGRLKAGATLEQVRAEMAAIAQQTAASHPGTGEPLRAVALIYAQQVIEDPSMMWMMRVAQLFAGVLTVVVAINLAILVYARTVTRLGEIAVRSALGATRRRILSQLFLESLVLALLGAVAGLGLARYALDLIQALNQTLPFWITFELSPGSAFFALALAMVAAFIMGVLPGLKATGVGVNANLHELHGRSGTRLGATWTTLIVAQVAVAVAVLPVAVFMAWRVVQMEMAGNGFAAESVVVATAGPAPDAPPAELERLAAQQLQLMARLEAEPGVVGVAFSDRMPGNGPMKRIRFEDGVRVKARTEHVPDIGITDALWPTTTKVSVDQFDTYGVQIVAGRNFAAADIGTTNVIVNRSFVDMYLQESNAIGLSFRFDSKAANALPPRWYEIVGVVNDFPAFQVSFTTPGEPTVYHPAGVGEISPVILSVRFASAAPPTFINRLRQIGAEVDPTLQLTDVNILADFYEMVRGTLRSVAWAGALVTTSV